MVSQSYLQSGEPAVEHTDCVAVEGQLVLSIQESVQLIGWEVCGGLWWWEGRGGEGRGERREGEREGSATFSSNCVTCCLLTILADIETF